MSIINLPPPPQTPPALHSRARTEASSTRVAGDEGQDIDAPIVPGARRKPRATADAVAQRQAANKPAVCLWMVMMDRLVLIRSHSAIEGSGENV
jgi:hypothetical protein